MMIRNILLICCFSLLKQSATAQVLIQQQLTKMGSIFDITVLDKDSLSAKAHIQQVADEIERIENLISEWRPATQIAQVNQNAGIRPVKVDREVFELTRRALEYSQQTDGAFDISIVALDKIWVFDGTMEELPTQEMIRKSVQHVGYRSIILDSVNMSIYLAKKGMKIGFGSIGKGYAADKGRELLQRLGVQGGIVNAAGDLSTWGSQPDGKPWKIGIRNPFKTYDMLKVLNLHYGAVATSGNSEKFAEIKGKRYSHIINPKTGWPSTGLASVTVSGQSAEFANYLSTSMMVLGKKEGKKLLRKYPDYKAFFVKDK